MFIALYIFLCLIVALLGWGTKLGYFWNFILALLLTPFVVLIAHMIVRTKRRNSVVYARQIVEADERRHGLRR